MCTGLWSAPADALPRVWTYDPPVGDAAESGVLTPMIRTPAWAYLSPIEVADEVCDLIGERKLGEGDVAILLFAFGRGGIFGHPLDALASPPAPAGLTAAPWTLNGRQAAREWTEQFIKRYQQRAAAEALPSPSRWHMDCEYRLPALCYLPDVESCWGTKPLEYFEALKQDPRWSSEPLLMNPKGTPAQSTLEQLYISAGSPSYDPTLPRGAIPNRAWSIWWDGVTREAMEGALKVGFYDVVQSAWPASLTSEFASSMRLDGGLEPDGSLRQFVDFEWWDNGWMRSRWDGPGDLQAPTLYLFGESFLDGTGDVWQQNLRLHRANLDACLHSYGGVSPTEVTPWVCMPGFPLPDGSSPTGARAITQDEFISMIGLLRARDISEFMVFPGATPHIWNGVVRAIESAWGTSLASVTVMQGSTKGPMVERARIADRNSLDVATPQGLAEIAVGFSGAPQAGCAGAGRFWLALELSAESGGEAAVSVVGPDGEVALLSTFPISTSLPGAQWLGPFSTAGRLSDDGSLTIRINATLPGDGLQIDLIQAVIEHAATPDLDGDDRVQAEDLAQMLSEWGAPSAKADLDRDGAVGASDLAFLLSSWGLCP
jgi:hypothetical protein